ncbi:hypothetical protein ACQ4LE_003001 [Meloidogyne hapla]|uniref:Uncharacterized protein n=1 Tax=Meloidogyne hapla TaxID=6305 RepID=A0A1I8B1T5_MELHA
MPSKNISSSTAFTFYRFLLPLALIAIFFCISVQSLTAMEGSVGTEQKEMDEKRAIPVRNPYSWMALVDDTQQFEKRSALRRPQNPYSWMAGGEPNSEWTVEGLRPFSAAAKRLAVARAGISRNPYSWTNY